MVLGSGFMTGEGFWVWGLGCVFGVEGSGFGASGFGCRV
jgi:hypothetical protein